VLDRAGIRGRGALPRRLLLPNVLIDDGAVTGYLDLGELGVADRWWDLAVATWSCDWYVGPGWQDLFLDTYGIERDDDKIEFYRLLYDLAS
jgi:kanamycin kinase